MPTYPRSEVECVSFEFYSLCHFKVHKSEVKYMPTYPRCEVECVSFEFYSLCHFKVHLQKN